VIPVNESNYSTDSGLKIVNGNTVSEDDLVSSKRLAYKPYGPRKVRFCLSSSGSNLVTIQMLAVLNV
jgi:hypothetical protein